MAKHKPVDIIDVKQAIKNRELRVFIERGNIFLKDMVTDEIVQIGRIADESNN